MGSPMAWELDDAGKTSSRLWEAKFHFGMPKKNVKNFIFSDDTKYIINFHPETPSLSRGGGIEMKSLDIRIVITPTLPLPHLRGGGEFPGFRMRTN